MFGIDHKVAIFDVRDAQERLITNILVTPLTNRDRLHWTYSDETTHGGNDAALLESSRYEYRLENTELKIKEVAGIIQRSAFSNTSTDHGMIQTGNFVGTLPIALEAPDGTYVASARVEVRSKKLDYESEYQDMLSEIADWCVDIVNDIKGPTQTDLSVDPGSEWHTLQERYFLLNGIINSREFSSAIHRILVFPHSQLKEEIQELDLRKGIRWTSAVSRQFASSSRRRTLPKGHALTSRLGITSIPAYVKTEQKSETLDTSANQFVKFALEFFEFFLTEISLRLKTINSAQTDRIEIDRAGLLIEQVENTRNQISEYLTHSMFGDISRLRSIPYGNPVLQRKAGYREVFSAWLKFQLGSKLSWDGGSEVFGGGLKDVATLYEYWVFFKLLDVLGNIASVDGMSLADVFEETKDGLALKVKAGRFLGPIVGDIDGKGRSFRIEFCYNKSFNYSPNWQTGTSWTRTLRPDYTFEIWPSHVEKSDAERQGNLVRVLFDAKYRANINDVFSDNSDDETQESGESRVYVREDLLKMHAYRDAIRRTEGAYVLFPGDKQTVYSQYGEILPGLGAFPLRPNLDTAGAASLLGFFEDLVENLSNRMAIRERLMFERETILSQGTKPPVFLSVNEDSFLSAGYFSVPPADSFHVLMVNCAEENVFEWSRSEETVAIFLDSEFRFGAFLASATRADLLIFSFASQGSFVLNEHWPNSFEIMSSSELLSSGYPGAVSAGDIALVVNTRSEGKELPNLPVGLLESAVRRMDSVASVVSLAQLIQSEVEKL